MNANQEFIDHTQEKKIKCASLSREQYYTDKFDYVLRVNFSGADYQDFLKQLDFNYDDGYGGQNLYGIIWYEDGTWSSRGEYDGSEWWEHNECPVINEKCL